MRALTNFEEVYAVYFDDVYRYLLSLSGSESVAEELTSETFFRAMDALDRFRGECSVRVWLCQIAKNEAGLAIISHSVVDFLAPEVKMYGQALLDIPCYKILMGCDGKNLQETKDLYNLTDAEQELLESKRRGHALFIIGSKRLHVNFEIPAYKFSYMGKAGGR